MGVLDVLRRLILVHHEEEHREVNRALGAADAELTALEVRVRRLEIERRLRERRIE